MALKIDKKEKKSLNRNPFNEKLIHRFFLESLYFYEGVKTKNLIPDNIHPEIKPSNLVLVVPEDARKDGYRPDFTLFFKNYDKEVPVEIKWKSSDFIKDNQTKFIKKNNGFLVVLKEDAKIDVPTIVISHKDFQDWMARRIFTLSRDSLASKDILEQSSGKWIVALRGDSSLKNFKRMMEATSQHFWAFKNSKYVTKQIFNLQKNDEMLFLFFKSSEDAMGMTSDKPNRKFEVLGWAEVSITEPYYICLDGEQASFFEEIRKGDKVVSVADRKWVHFIDFRTLEFKEGLSLERKREGFDSYLVSSSNQGGALTSVPSNVYKDILSFVKTETYRPCDDQ